MQELDEALKTKFSKKKWELSMEISAKPDNVYMGSF